MQQPEAFPELLSHKFLYLVPLRLSHSNVTNEAGISSSCDIPSAACLVHQLAHDATKHSKECCMSLMHEWMVRLTLTVNRCVSFCSFTMTLAIPA